MDWQHEEIEEAWISFTTTLYKTTKEVTGYAKWSHQDCFDHNSREIQELLIHKNNAHLSAINNLKLQQAQNTFCTVYAAAQRVLGKMENDWWTIKAIEIQGFVDKNDQQQFYSAIKSASGLISKSMLIKDQ